MDDVSQTITGRTTTATVTEAIHRGAELVEHLNEEGLQAASKSTVIASSKDMVIKVAAGLAKKGIHVKVAEHTEDLWGRHGHGG